MATTARPEGGGRRQLLLFCSLSAFALLLALPDTARGEEGQPSAEVSAIAPEATPLLVTESSDETTAGATADGEEPETGSDLPVLAPDGTDEASSLPPGTEPEASPEAEESAAAAAPEEADEAAVDAPTLLSAPESQSSPAADPTSDTQETQQASSGSEAPSSEVTEPAATVPGALSPEPVVPTPTGPPAPSTRGETPVVGASPSRVGQVSALAPSPSIAAALPTAPGPTVDTCPDTGEETAGPPPEATASRHEHPLLQTDRLHAVASWNSTEVAPSSAPGLATRLDRRAARQAPALAREMHQARRPGPREAATTRPAGPQQLPAEPKRERSAPPGSTGSVGGSSSSSPGVLAALTAFLAALVLTSTRRLRLQAAFPHPVEYVSLPARPG